MFNLHLWKKKEEDPLKHFKPDWIPKEEPEMRYYSIGPTSHGRVQLNVAYGNVSLNRLGIDNLIKVLETSKMWLEESGKQPDNGCQEEETPV